MSISLFSPWGFIFLGLVAYLLHRWIFEQKAPGKLPPGPNPHFLLGNLRDFPPEGVPEFQHWLKHKDEYGPISSVTVFGMTVVLIHDKAAAHDILERYSSKTSGRPYMMFANKLCGYESVLLCQGYDGTYRRYRKLVHQELGTKPSAAKFQHIQEAEVDRQLVRALNDPDNLLENFKTTTSSIMLKMTYGYTIDPTKPDKMIELIQQMMTEFSLAAAPMAWMVDVIPALQFIPENFPGGGFKKTARKWKNTLETVAYAPYRFVWKQMATDSFSPSYVSKLVEALQHKDSEGKGLDPELEKEIIWTAASLYGAGADTTIITLTTFTLAMVMFPEVQRRAQEEIDAVVGTERLPTFEDREELPYINALVQEALRWWPIAPMGFPHAVDEGFAYNDYYIPKGAYLMPSIWWFLHDPDVYANPDAFDPARFLSPRNEPDPSSEAFGYGRRVCEGKYFTYDGLYINIVRSLATFNITAADGADGEPENLDVKTKPGVLGHPTNFRVKVTPRSKQHVEMIRNLEEKIKSESADDHQVISHSDSLEL